MFFIGIEVELVALWRRRKISAIINNTIRTLQSLSAHCWIKVFPNSFHDNSDYFLLCINSQHLSLHHFYDLFFIAYATHWEPMKQPFAPTVILSFCCFIFVVKSLLCYFLSSSNLWFMLISSYLLEACLMLLFPTIFIFTFSSDCVDFLASYLYDIAGIIHSLCTLYFKHTEKLFSFCL